jgi:hypothetical protein
LVSDSGFNQVGQGTAGSLKGRNLAESIAARYPKDIVLIVVAGMQYAVYVAARGYDVLTSAEDKAQEQIPKILKQLGFNV